MKPLVVVFAAIVTVFLAGCLEPEPSYSVTQVTYDPGLIGEWRYEEVTHDDAGNPVTRHFELTLSPRTLSVKDGRIQPEQLFGESRPMASAQTGPNAYRGVLRGPDHGEQELDVELKGFLIAIDDWRFLAFQPSSEQMKKGGDLLNLISLPIHQAFRIQREGDRLTISFPATRLAWLPGVQWLDAPSSVPDEPSIPIGEEDNKGRLVVTGDIDRFVAALRRSALREDFWGDAVVLTRQAP